MLAPGLRTIEAIRKPMPVPIAKSKSARRNFERRFGFATIGSCLSMKPEPFSESFSESPSGTSVYFGESGEVILKQVSIC